jgi:ribosomal protein S18 acetylase RimI-like enzyme
MSISIRPLSDPDLECADAILKSAFGGTSSRLFDLQMNRQIQPDGWFLALQQERPVGIVGATNYGAYAYVGMMGVHREAQRQGVGLALMQFLLGWLDRQQVPLTVLDASQAGQPMYEKLGFVPYDETLSFQHIGGFPSARPLAHVELLSVQELDALVEFDSDIFGANRSKVLQVLLEAFPKRAFMLLDKHDHITGYLCAQKSKLGPWISRSLEDAELLLRAAMTLPFEESISIVVPSINLEAIDLLGRYGFEKVRTNRHMGRGQAFAPSQRRIIYGQTSLSLG